SRGDALHATLVHLRLVCSSTRQCASILTISGCPRSSGLSLAAVPVASAHAPDTTRSRPARCVPALLPTGLLSSTRRFGCTLVRHPALPDQRLSRSLLAPGPRFLAHMDERLSLRRVGQPPERSVGLRWIVRPQRRDRRVQVPALERAMPRRRRTP